MTVELPGRVEAFRLAQVRARVPGIVQERLFEEGARVEANQPLFQIDPSELRAQLNTAEAAVAKARDFAAKRGVELDLLGGEVRRCEGLSALGGDGDLLAGRAGAEFEKRGHDGVEDLVHQTRVQSGHVDEEVF